jgi:hypothetical protein
MLFLFICAIFFISVISGSQITVFLPQRTYDLDYRENVVPWSDGAREGQPLAGLIIRGGRLIRAVRKSREGGTTAQRIVKTGRRKVKRGCPSNRQTANRSTVYHTR